MKRLFLIAGSTLLLLLAGGALLLPNSKTSASKAHPAGVTNSKQQEIKRPANIAEFMAMTPDYLEKADIALMNLLCAQGLPGAENLNVDECLTTLDKWAQHVNSETTRNFHKFREDPAYFYNSEAFYKMLMMSVVVYEDLGVRYNPKWIAAPSETRPDDHFFGDSRDLFIHGMVGPQHLGTCSSMPILYIALGRRLGYPLKLVTTRGHLFVRWDSATEKFNMDATGKGLNRRDDNYYKNWPHPISDQEIQEEGYLKSLTPREELSVFFSIRAACLGENGFIALAANSFQVAYLCAPNWKQNQLMLARAQQGPISMGQPFNPVFQQHGASRNISADLNPLQQIQSTRKFQ